MKYKKKLVLVQRPKKTEIFTRSDRERDRDQIFRSDGDRDRRDWSIFRLISKIKNY